MTKIEALELELAARKMVEGTGVYWVGVIRCKESKKTFDGIKFSEPKDWYELALGILKGEPVWEGNTLYNEAGSKSSADIGMGLPGKWSWNPPKHKNIPHRERLTANAEDFDNIITEILAENEAFRKTLENLK